MSGALDLSSQVELYSSAEMQKLNATILLCGFFVAECK